MSDFIHGRYVLGRLAEGDQVLEVNGQSLDGVTNDE